MDSEIVVSGISGKFPSCKNIEEFQRKLFDGEELAQEQPWGLEDGSVPQRIGRLNSYQKFDAAFFGLLPSAAHSADPMCRKLLETAFEALVDAGVNPNSIKGKKCGVYIGACPSESSQVLFESLNKRFPNVRNTFTVSHCFMAQRISYFFGITGPSMVIDAGCSSSLVALHCAVRDIQSGVCDSAFVGGANIIGLPYLTQYMMNDKLLSTDGRCKSFDAKGNGFVRSEAAVVLYIQKKEVARRNYCVISKVAVANEGFKEEGIACTSAKAQALLMQDCYKSYGINPLKVGYVEGHGPGTKAGDPEEMRAIDDVFTKGRDGPLIVGSVKSNMGHAEAVAALCSMAKLIIAMETGKMPGTLHYHTPNPNIPALVNGRVKVHNKTVDFDEQYCAINSFGMGGSISHALLKRDSKLKQPVEIVNELPWFLFCSGRTEESVACILKNLNDNPIDHEFASLLRDVFTENIRNHQYRGYIVKDEEENKCLQDISVFSDQPRPICFFFSGMGSHWPTMGKDLMKIPAFKESIARSAAIMNTKGVDVYRIIGCDEPGLFEYILNSFVGITVMQIALVDTLKFLGVEPDYIIGHSFGEVSCAYADGCFTAEQTLLTSYYRGLVSVETVFAPGAMAAVGKGYRELQNQLPEGLEVACHNSSNSCTLSGRKQVVRSFCEWLTKQGVFVSELSTCGIAYHSSFIATAGAKLLGHLTKLIPEPKERSSKWVSTSTPEREKCPEISNFSSAEYHCCNFLNPVLFEENFTCIPENSIVIEVAPHGLMQGVLRNFDKRDIINIPLANKNADSNLQFFLASLGRIYQAGANPKIGKLYPEVSYPVSRGTPMISPLIQWDHSQDWYTPLYEDETLKGIKRLNIKAGDKDNVGYTIYDSPVLPYSTPLVLAWKGLAAIIGKKMDKTDVVFSDLRFHSWVALEDDCQLETNFQKSGNFEVSRNGELIVSGHILERTVPIIEVPINKAEIELTEFDVSLQTADIYTELRLKGTEVYKSFQSLHKVDPSLTIAEVEYSSDWVKMFEAFIQFAMLQSRKREIQRPYSIKRLTVSATKCVKEPQETFQILYTKGSSKIFTSYHIQVVDLTFESEPNQRKYKTPLIHKYEWFPHVTKAGLSKEEGLKLGLQLIAENIISAPILHILEVSADSENGKCLSPLLIEASSSIPRLMCEYVIQQQKNFLHLSDNPSKSSSLFHLLISPRKLVSDDVKCVDSVLHPGGFLLLHSDQEETPYSLPGFVPCFDYKWDQGHFVLLCRRSTSNSSDFIDMSAEESFGWLSDFIESLKEEKSVTVVSSNPTSGIVGLLKSAQQEYSQLKIRGFLILDKDAPPFSFNSKFYSNQMSKGLFLNILKNGVWGSFRHLDIQLNSQPLEQVLWKNNNTLVEGPFNRLTKLNSNLIAVYYSVLNTEELRTNQHESEEYLAAFSGRRTNGTRVMGLATNPFASVMSMVEPSVYLTWDVPISWTLRDAASVPYAYCQALMCLQHIKDNPSSNIVLICGADSSPIGFALAKVAHAWGSSVYAICSNSSTKQILQFLLPEINPKRIFPKTDLASAYACLQPQQLSTIVDLNGDAEFTNILHTGGTTIYINKDSRPETLSIPKNYCQKTVDFLTYIKDGNNLRYLKESLQKLLECHCTPPLSKIRKVSEATPTDESDEESSLFVKLLNWRDAEQRPICPSPILTWNAKPMCWFDPQASYILAGGLGGFGLELANWMVQRGARKLVFCSRRGVTNGYQALRLRTFESLGVFSTIMKHNIATENGVEKILKESAALGPVAGIFNLAAVFGMAMAPHMNAEIMQAENDVKMKSAEYFDTLTRKYCPDLKYFVLFSSTTASFGALGSTSYSYSNSRAERLCDKRAAEGYPAKALQWGLIGDIGILLKQSQINVKGFDIQPIQSCLSVLDTLLLHQSPVPCSYVIEKKLANCIKGRTPLERICDVLGLPDVSNISMEATLSAMGMDSMLLTEVRNILQSEFNLSFSPAEIRRLSVRNLHELNERAAQS